MTSTCDDNYGEFCQLATRNNPTADAQPAFIAWPTNASQVQTCVRFAVKHNLCITVAGAGHELLRRHTCKDSLFIRTTLIKGFTWNMTDSRHSEGTIKVGSGTVFAEV